MRLHRKKKITIFLLLLAGFIVFIISLMCWKLDARYGRDILNWRPVQLKDRIYKMAKGDEEDWETVMDGRLAHLKSICYATDLKKLRGLTPEGHISHHLVLDRNHSLVYCGIEKIGSTFWRRFFQVLENEKLGTPFDILPTHALQGGETFQKLSLLESVFWLSHSKYRFLFVREPYSRLFSGYVDKLVSPNLLFWNGLGRHIVGKFRQNPSELSLNCGHDVTFPEFVKYIIHAEETGERRDGHFLPMYDHCKPCYIEYNIIGKMETFRDDTLYILDRLNLEKMKLKLSNFSAMTLEDTVEDVASAVFRIRDSALRCITFREALDRIWTKMQIRGIIDSRIPLLVSDNATNTLTEEDFVQLIMHANQKSDQIALKRQKKEQLINAYKNVPLSDLQKVKALFKPDFNLFGYEEEPSDIFSRK